MFRSVCGATGATEAEWTQPPAHHQHKDECTPTAQELSAHLTNKNKLKHGLRSCDTEASHGLIAYSNVSAEIGQSGCVHRHPSLGECLSDSWPIDIGSEDPNGRNEKAEARLSVTQPSTRQFSPMSRLSSCSIIITALKLVDVGWVHFYIV